MTECKKKVKTAGIWVEKERRSCYSYVYIKCESALKNGWIRVRGVVSEMFALRIFDSLNMPAHLWFRDFRGFRFHICLQKLL